LRERLRERGRERAARFTWQRTASLTLASYARVLGSDAPGPASGSAAAPRAPGVP
jgi:hypothetical protein